MLLLDIFTTRIGFLKKIRLISKLISVYYIYAYGIVNLILLAYLFIVIYGKPNGYDTIEFIKYYFYDTNIKIIPLLIFLVDIYTIVKYMFEPKQEGLHEGQGDIYYELNKMDLAEIAYKKSLEINPNRIYALQRLGDLCKSLSDYDRAIEYYTKSLHINNKLVYSWKGLGDIYFAQSMTSEAIGAYEAALNIKSIKEIKPKLAILYRKEGESHICQKNYDDAIKSFEKSVLNDSTLGDSWELLGDTYAQKGLHEKAIDAFEKAIKLNPTSVLNEKLLSSLLILGPQYYKDRDLKRSKEVFCRATKINSQSVQAWAYLGNIYSEQGNLEDAKVAYEKAISIDPNLASTYIGLGNVLAQQGKFEEAEKAYKNAISIDPNLASTYIGLGNVLAQQGKFAEAEKAYKKAISIDLNLASIHIGLGNVLAQQGKFVEAEKAYRNAISIDPNLASSYIGLGNVLAQQQRYQESLDAYNDAIKCDAGKATMLKESIDSLKLRIELEQNFSLLNKEINNVAILLDTSATMQGQKIEDAKEVIIKAIKSIPINHKPLNIIFFGASINEYRLESNDRPDLRDCLIDRIMGIEADGKTPLHGALNHAWKYLIDKDHRIIIIVTDGMPNDALPGVILDYAKSLKNAGCRIVSIGIGNGANMNENFLRNIASSKEDFHFADVDLSSIIIPVKYEYRYRSEQL